MISVLDSPTSPPLSEEDMARVENERKKKLSQFVLAWYAELKADRGGWERLWQEARELVRPNAKDFTVTVPVWQMRKQRIYDNFPSQALHNLAAGVQSNLTNAASRWFAFSTGDSAVDQQDAVAAWLETSSNIVFDEIYHPEAGFNLASLELYLDWGGFGTGVFQFTEGDDHLHFRSVPLSEACISENDHGIIDVVFREFQLTKRAALLKWPNLPAKIAAGETQQEYISFIHAVYPIESEIRFKSVYVHKESGEVIEEGMFMEFPYNVVRWAKMAGDVYGRGPGIDNLEDIRVLNEANRLMLQSDQLASAPPVIFENDGVLNKVVLQPWGQLMIAPGSQFPKTLEIKGDLNVTDKTVEDKRTAIGKAFFNDLFESFDGGNRERVTAEEVSTDTNSKLRRLAPVTGRMEIEHLNILVKRVFMFLYRKKRIPEMPPILKQKKLKVQYLSPATQALRAQKAKNNLQFVQTVVPFLQVKPDLLDSLNLDIVMQEAGFAFDISRTAVLSPQAVAAIRQQRAQQQAAQQQSEQAVNATQGVLNVANAQKAAPGMLQQLGGQ